MTIKSSKSKKAFTLIEIIIALVISAMIGAYMLAQKQKSNFTSDVDKFAQTLVSMIQNGVIDSTVGYVSSSCNGNGDYHDISASNIKDCTGWNNYTIGGTSGDDGSQNWFEGQNLLRQYTSGGDGCKVYFDEDTGDTTIFYMFVDCSNLNYDNGADRYKKYVEDRVGYFLESSLPTVFQSKDENAIDITGTGGGDDKDGMVLLKFKK